MHLQEYVDVSDGICRFRPHGDCSLIEAVNLIIRAIAYCRERSVNRLLVNATGLTRVPIPSLVDRFLMIEEWAQEAKGIVLVVLVVHAEYIHPEKFGVRAAADFGLVADIFISETDAFKWLLSGVDPR